MSKKENIKDEGQDYDITEVVEVPKDLVEVLKEKYGDDLHKCIVPLDDVGNKELEVAIIVPSRKVMGQAMKFMDTNNVKAQEILIKACALTSKERILGDDALFSAVAMKIIELYPIREARLGKF